MANKWDSYSFTPGTVVSSNFLNDVVSKNQEFVSVKDFGAVCDGVTDDTTAFQAAVDSVGDTSITQRSGLTLLISGPIVITNTITVRRKSIKIVGTGWGRISDTFENRSMLIWGGAAGIPMIKVQDTLNFQLDNIRFVGSSTNKPSAAINFNETNDGWPNSANKVSNIYIGSISGETDDNEQFTNGILIDGLGASNSELIIDNLYLRKITQDGIHVGSSQNLNIHVTNFWANNCSRAAIYNCGAVQGETWSFANNAVDIYVPGTDDNALTVNGLTLCNGFFSERSGRLAEIFNGTISLTGGRWALATTTNTDGKVIKAEGSSAIRVTLTDFRFNQISSPPTAPYLSFDNGTASPMTRSVLLNSIEGWGLLTGGTSGISALTGSSQDRVYIYFKEHLTSGGTTKTRVSENNYVGNALNWDINRGPDFPVVATASLPAAGNNMNGAIIIEDAGAGDRNLIIYAGGQRFRVDGGAAI